MDGAPISTNSWQHSVVSALLIFYTLMGERRRLVVLICVSWFRLWSWAAFCTYLLRIVFSLYLWFPIICSFFLWGCLPFSYWFSGIIYVSGWWYFIGCMGCKYILPDWRLYFLLYWWCLLLNRILNFNVSETPNFPYVLCFCCKNLCCLWQFGIFTCKFSSSCTLFFLHDARHLFSASPADGAGSPYLPPRLHSRGTYVMGVALPPAWV